MTASTNEASRADDVDVTQSGATAAPYNEEVIRWFVIATTFWGVVAFLMGTFIAFQLAFPVLNLGLEYTTFGRLRPVHTSAAIFAFGGNALIATSLYVVQRTCRASLFGGPGARELPLFWGYQLFIVLAATRLCPRRHSVPKEYAEPEWYVDLWLTLVWVVYLVIFARHHPSPQRTAHLRRQLVLPRLYRHGCDAAHRQQSGCARLVLRHQKLCLCFQACRMR